jgi:antitoxin HigA-1
MSSMHNPAHPGEVLREYLPEELGVSEAAKRLGVTRQALSALINGRAGVSASMALRLEAALGTSAEMWLGMQTNYDLWHARKRRAPKVARIAPSSKAA